MKHFCFQKACRLHFPPVVSLNKREEKVANWFKLERNHSVSAIIQVNCFDCKWLIKFGKHTFKHFFFSISPC